MASKEMELTGLVNFDCVGDPATIGQRWKRWRRAFDLYVDGKGVTLHTQKRSLLLHTAGMQVQDIFFTLPGVTPSEDVYKDAVDMLDRHFVKDTNTTVERHIFRNLRQESGEAVDQFFTRLKRQAMLCEFKDAEDEHICDQIVEKCNSGHLRRKLLEKGAGLTVTRACEIARAFEIANQQALVMESADVSAPMEPFGVNKLQTSLINQRSTEKKTPRHGKCFNCGQIGHYSYDKECLARGRECENCSKIGHLAIMCRSRGKTNWKRKQNRKKKTFQLEAKDEDSSSNEGSETRFAFAMHTVNKVQHPEDVVQVNVGGVNLQMFIDSGANCNVIDAKEWERCKKQNINCQSSKGGHNIKVYGTSKELQVIGKFKADVQLDLTNKDLKGVEFLVIEGSGVPILGKNTAKLLNVLRVGREVVKEVAMVEETRDDWVREYLDVFTIKEGTFAKIKDFQLTIPIDQTITPVAQHPRRTPYKLRNKLEEKVKELLDRDIIEPVEGPTPWVSPVVLVPQTNDEVRLCVDMRRANKAVLRERVQLPTFEELLQEMSGSTVFSKLDIRMAYHQIELSPESRDITTFSTHVGLYRYKRLMFGVSCAPEMFQRVMRQVVVKCQGVINFLDDLVVHGRDKREHDQRLRQLLETLRTSGLVLNRKKCEIGKPQIMFLGHEVSQKGIRPSKSNLETVQEFRTPRTSEEVQSFLGLVNFCARFIPCLATINAPLRKLTKKTTPFVWGKLQETAFQKLKTYLTDPKVLALFDVKAPTRVVTDASPVGLGAVLVQVQGGIPRVVCFASRGLTEVEQRYSQTEKEALGIVWACERFKMYLLGNEFELYTDHRPLEVIYSARSKPSARIERWVLRLQPYHFVVKYQPGKLNIADPLSRLLKHPDEYREQVKEVDYVQWVATVATPRAITTREIEETSAEDHTLGKVREAIAMGNFDGDLLRPFRLIQTELCSIGFLVLRGTRLVIPEGLRSHILEIAHEGHPGVTVMKRNLRSKVWWPRIDREVEQFCAACHGCQVTGRGEPPEPMCRLELPAGPWEHVAVDFQGPLPSGDYLLVVVDYYSRYMEVYITKDITTKKTLRLLGETFARHGLPEVVHSDNGPQFVSQEYKMAMKNWGIHIHNVTPLWPQANGEVERQNRSLLKRLKIAQVENANDWKMEIHKFLLMYRSSPHSTTGVSPAELLFNRKIRNRLPQFDGKRLDDEEVRDTDRDNKDRGKTYADQRRRARPNDLQPGDLVLLKQPRKNKLTPTYWPEPFRILEKHGNVVEVQSTSGNQLRRNSTFTKKFTSPDQGMVHPQEMASENKPEEMRDGGTQDEPDTFTTRNRAEEGPPDEPDKRPTRNRTLPKYLDDYVLDSWD